MKESQFAFVADELLVEGFISRNFCLKHYISRLGAIICKLKQFGLDIEGKYELDGDYIYYFTGPREQRKILKKIIK